MNFFELIFFLFFLYLIIILFKNQQALLEKNKNGDDGSGYDVETLLIRVEEEQQK